MSKRRDGWIDEDEYPDDRDVEDLGEDSQVDYDRLTMERVGNMQQQPFWTRTRIFVVLVLGIIILSLVISALGGR